MVGGETWGPDDGPVIRLVNLIVSQAVAGGVRDVHLDPNEGGLAVRYRSEGGLYLAMQVPVAARGAVVDRLKTMASMDLADRERPQSGLAPTRVGGRKVDVWVSTLPTVLGERLALRLTTPRPLLVGLERLGLEPRTLEALLEAVAPRRGVVVACGPTQSGKTAALCSLLARVRTPGARVMTTEWVLDAEVPEAFRVDVVANRTSFSECIRTFVEQRADFILAAELIDLATVHAVFEAASTSLVLTTLHVPRPGQTYGRLLDMGACAEALAATPLVLLGVRLLPTLCAACREPYRPSAADLASVGCVQRGDVTLFRKRGCPACGGVGYGGRTGAFELRVASLEVRDLERAARERGLLTFRQSALRKALLGEVSLEDAASATPRDDPAR